MTFDRDHRRQRDRIVGTAKLQNATAGRRRTPFSSSSSLYLHAHRPPPPPRADRNASPFSIQAHRPLRSFPPLPWPIRATEGLRLRRRRRRPWGWKHSRKNLLGVQVSFSGRQPPPFLDSSTALLSCNLNAPLSLSGVEEPLEVHDAPVPVVGEGEFLALVPRFYCIFFHRFFFLVSCISNLWIGLHFLRRAGPAGRTGFGWR